VSPAACGQTFVGQLPQRFSKDLRAKASSQKMPQLVRSGTSLAILAI
jgi:hypothetical protein